jgi:hypothetical protein
MAEGAFEREFLAAGKFGGTAILFVDAGYRAAGDF